MNQTFVKSQPLPVHCCRYTAEGFTVNSTDVQGAVLCLSNLVLHWNVRNLSEVTVDSLAVLDVIKPKPGKEGM